MNPYGKKLSLEPCTEKRTFSQKDEKIEHLFWQSLEVGEFYLDCMHSEQLKRSLSKLDKQEFMTQ